MRKIKGFVTGMRKLREWGQEKRKIKGIVGGNEKSEKN